jgi:hypothetical protein
MAGVRGRLNRLNLPMGLPKDRLLSTRGRIFQALDSADAFWF